MFTAAFSLCQCLLEDFLVDTVNFNIHLDGGNAIFSTGNFKVHIAESIFKTLNIGKNSKIIAVFNKAHCYAGNRRFNRHACIHKGKGACANAAHGGRTVGLQGFGNQADCIGEFFFGRNYRKQCTFCQCAMADFAAARAAQRFGFANAVRREVIMMDIAFGKFYAESVQSLCFAERSQCQYVQNLGLATGKQCAAVRAGQKAYFAGYRAHFIKRTSVRADFIHGNGAAYNLFNQFLGNISNVSCVIRIFFHKRFSNFCFNACYVFFAFQLVGIHQGCFKLFCSVSFNFCCQFSRRLVNRHFHFGFAYFGHNLFLPCNKSLNFFVTEENSIKHFIFADFLSACFYHQNSIFGTGNGKVQTAYFSLFNSRVDDVFAVNHAYAHTGDRAFKRNIGNAECAGCANHCRNVRCIVRVHGNGGSNNLHIVMIAFREHRANRAVDKTAG